MLRQAQLDAFRAALTREFEDLAWSYFQNLFPDACRQAGEDVIRRVIRHGVMRAERHALDEYQSLCMYITVMFWLGSGFDQDPLYPWAAPLLAPELGDQLQRAERLKKAAQTYLDEAEGLHDEHLQETLRRLLGEDLATLFPPPAPAEDARTYLTARLHHIHPRKCEAVGLSSLHRLIDQGIAAATRYGLVERPDQAVYLEMMFLLGAAFDEDPMFPWAQELLHGGRTQGARQGQALHRAGIASLQHMTGVSP
ncbi:MAG TPA: hypothetical protein VH877_13475 [Polyangia bacterium]|nr:hypothetical protein [Polyangia bacterium]